MGIKTVDLHKDYKVGDNVIHAVNGVDLEIKDGTSLRLWGNPAVGKQRSFISSVV